MIQTDPEISSALDALQVAHEQIRLAYDGFESAKRVLSEAARRYLMESPEGELLSRAAFVYWNLTDVPPSLVASVVIGDSKSINKLRSLLPAQASGVKCESCGAVIDVNSRSALTALRNEARGAGRAGQRAWPLICKACRESSARQRADEYAPQREAEARRLQALHTMPYREYLFTEEWLETRNRKLKQARFSCQLCNSGGLLNVHHRTYDRRGYEDMADLIVLCHPCHANFHGKLP